MKKLVQAKGREGQEAMLTSILVNKMERGDRKEEKEILFLANLRQQ